MTHATPPGSLRLFARLAKTMQDMERVPTLYALCRTTLHGGLDLLGADTGMLLTHNAGSFLTERGTHRFRVRAVAGAFGDEPESTAISPALTAALAERIGHIEPFRVSGLLVLPTMTSSGEWACLVTRVDGQSPERSLAATALLQGFSTAFRCRIQKEHQNFDPATGAMTYHAGVQQFAQTLKLATRNDGVTSVVRVEVDDFHAVIQQHGLAASAIVARSVAQAVRRSTRASDILVRHGSSGFALVLPATPLTGGLQVAKSLGEYMAALRIDFEGQELHITTSFGVATSNVGSLDHQAILRRANEALASAQSHGGNRTATTDYLQPRSFN